MRGIYRHADIDVNRHADSLRDDHIGVPISGVDTVGLRIRHARKELRKMTQPQLAAAAGIKQPSLSELETGETKEISGPVLIALSKALRVRPEWLATGETPIELDVGTSLSSDERELVQDYRGASARWKVSLRYMAKLRGDRAQEEIAEGVNVLLAKIATDPVPDRRVEDAYGQPPRQGEHRFAAQDGAAPPPYQHTKKRRRDK